MAVQRSARLQAEYERIAGERLAAERQVERVYRRELVRVCLECFAWCFAALVLLGSALHSTNRETGMIFWWLGFIVGIAGIVTSILLAYRRGEERGDW